MKMGTRARSSVQFKGQSVFVEAEARRSSFYRSGDLAKYLQRLGCKIEEFQTSQGKVPPSILEIEPVFCIIIIRVSTRRRIFFRIDTLLVI